jgi:hypothetical protein
MRDLYLRDIILVMTDDHNFNEQNMHNLPSEPFGTGPNLSEELERVEKYSLTVREATRMFEEAGVPRTERSIVKWCTPNPHGLPRLMCRYDTNDRRWFITEDSVRIAIAEEIAKQREIEARNPQDSEHQSRGEEYTERPNEGERLDLMETRVFDHPETQPREEVLIVEKDKLIRELEYKLRDEQIASRAKDIVIGQMKNERTRLLDQAMQWSRQVGVLETKLIQIAGPEQEHTVIPNDSEQQEAGAQEGGMRRPGSNSSEYVIL